MEIVVSYEEASKNGDMSALTCFKPMNNDEFKMVVGAVSNEADEIFKIVSKQGYLKKHDSDLLDKVAEKLKAQFKDMQFHTGKAWFDFDAGIDRCTEKVDKVIEELKAEVR